VVAAAKFEQIKKPLRAFLPARVRIAEAVELQTFADLRTTVGTGAHPTEPSVP
jgi:hypothetical protein